MHPAEHLLGGAIKPHDIGKTREDGSRHAMMTGMFGFLTITTASVEQPTRAALTVAILVVAAGWIAHRWADWSTRSARPDPGGTARPEPLEGHQIEPPAVIGLLTNGFRTPNSAVTATALDLAARGWIRLSTIDGELVVVTRGNGSKGDTLLPYEQQVLNHLSSRAFNGVSSAGTMALSQHRLDWRWWMRFRRGVAGRSIQLGFSTPRYTALELAPPALAAAVGIAAAWKGVRGDGPVEFAEGWKSWVIWVGVTVAAVGLGWRTAERFVRSDQRPTDEGNARSAAWMGYRQRLAERIPGHASVLAPAPQQRALAQACVMGVAEHVLDQLPVSPEDRRRAWSNAEGVPHTVAVRYPMRPGYGQHPAKIALVGLVVFFAARWLRGFFNRVADGEALSKWLDKVPGQVDLIEQIAGYVAIACWVPLIWAVWVVFAGVVDSVATRERTGVVVRSCRPDDVIPPTLARIVRPFADRGGFLTYIAVDDGKHNTITAWLANERTSAPQGAQARVRATPLLGYVRSSEPVGTATRTTR